MSTKPAEPAKAQPSGPARRPANDLAERPRFDFLASSHDLAQGLDVQDLSDVTIPGDLEDSLFGSSRPL